MLSNNSIPAVGLETYYAESTFSVPFRGLVPDTQYNFSVTANNLVGESARSEWFTFRTDNYLPG